MCRHRQTWASPQIPLLFALSLTKTFSGHHELYGHRWVHLLFAVGVGKGGLDLPVARLQAVHERGHRCHRHRVMLHWVPHERRMQVLPLVWHDLGGLLAVQHREIGGHVDINIVHGTFGQAAVGL